MASLSLDSLLRKKESAEQALYLAKAYTYALDSDPALAAALEEKAQAQGLKFNSTMNGVVNALSSYVELFDTFIKETMVNWPPFTSPER